jgi:hypothetical protein
LWIRLRQEVENGPVRLTGKQVEALAGRYYRELVASCEEDPGPSTGSLGPTLRRSLRIIGRLRSGSMERRPIGSCSKQAST